AVKPDIFAAIGIKPLINARGHQTVLGGTTPSARVKEAMEAAERYYVDMAELLRRSGEIISELIQCEAAYVTPGAAAAMALGSAACVTGTDLDKMAQLPDTTGLKSRVIIQNAHRYSYDRAVTVPGPKLRVIGDENGTRPEELEEALDADVSCVLYPAHL